MFFESFELDDSEGGKFRGENSSLLQRHSEQC